MNPVTESVAPPDPHVERWTRYGSSPYLLGERIAAGGMGTVHLGLKQGALGFRRLLAIKRLHGHLAHEIDFVARFKDEIRLVSRLQHPNIVQTLDVLEESGELALVMEFVEGVTLHTLLKDARSVGVALPVPVAVGIVSQALHGLHCAHELVDDVGRPLHLVHRDVSPQNIIIAKDGLVKVLDFGVAKATSEIHVTRTGQISGKASYMSPEQILGSAVDRRTDVFAAGVVLWEALTGQRLFRPPGAPEDAALRNVLDMRIKAPRELREDLDPAVERATLRALDRDPARRFGSARDFALALEEAVAEASASRVASGVAEISGPRLAQHVHVTAADQLAIAETCVPSLRSAVTETAPPPLAALGSSSTTNWMLQVTGVEPELLTSDVPGVPLAVSSPRRRPVKSILASGLVIALMGLWLWRTTPFESQQRDEDQAAAKAAQQEHPTEPVGSGAEGLPAERVERDRGDHGAEREPRMNADVPQRIATTQQAKARRHASPQPRPQRAASRTDTAPPQRQGGGVRDKSRGVTSDKSPSTTSDKSRSVARESRGVASESRGVVHAVNCSPPTYTDAEGIRHFKPECL